MTPFLKAVAEDIYSKFGDNLSRTAIVFPGKRAGLFFNQYLLECAERPLWAPAYITISDLFGQLSSLSIEEPIRQVCLLHQIFNKCTQRTEPLDDFYYWGELMLADFDDIDKNMVEANSLFVNLADVKAFNSQFEFLTEEQKEVLERFFAGFRSEEQRTELKDRFIELWQVMGTIYHELKQQLHSCGLAYEGMMFRDAIENFNADLLTFDRYVFVGFNVLNQVELQLFRKLKECNKALFYWDYDHYYYDNPHHEAGLFVRENIARFGNALQDDAQLFDNLSHLPEISYISAPTDNAQARYLYDWLSTYHNTQQEQETAVILCNEDMALPVLHALPADHVRNVNVTMGFKLTQTPIYTLINSYLNLHTRGYDEEKSLYKAEEVRLLLTHPYINQLYPEASNWCEALLKTNRQLFPLNTLTAHPTLGILFAHHEDNRSLLETLNTLIDSIGQLFSHKNIQTKAPDEDIYTQLYEEALFRIHQLTTSFRSMLSDHTLKVKPRTLVRLMQRVMKQNSIPFHGEPAIGLQVMGVLETRNLDFRNLILLSTNEGKLPKSSNEASFIPYNLREAFGMTTIQRQNAVYAYYFYRMIQRAERVTIVYNDGTDGMNRQEPSRYVMQLQVEFPGKLTAQSIQAASQPSQHADICIEQTPLTLHKLQSHFAYDPAKKKNYKLSPSAINDWLDCRLKFYLKHVEGLVPPQEQQGDVDVSHFGSIFHKSAELAYEQLTERGNIIRASDLQTLYSNEIAIEALVNEAFRLEFFHTEKGEPLPFNGTQYIVQKAITSYLIQLLRMDERRAPFKYIGSEVAIHHPITVASHGKELSILLGGKVDRIDNKEDITRIIDYKTGGKQKTVGTVSDLFDRGKSRDGYVFQAFYYAHLLQHDYPQIAPSLLFVRNTSKDIEPDIIVNGTPVTDFNEYSKEFGTLLTRTIDEIFNSDTPYTAAENKEACKYCKLLSLCKRTIENNYM